MTVRTLVLKVIAASALTVICDWRDGGITELVVKLKSDCHLSTSGLKSDVAVVLQTDVPIKRDAKI